MSTGLELIPVAIAIGAVVARRKARRAAGGGAAGGGAAHEPSPVIAVQTLSSRMKDEALLRSTVGALGQVFGERNGALYAAVNGRAVVFTRAEDGTFDVHVEGTVGDEEAEALVRELDAVYGLRVQDQVYRRVTARAAQFGFALESESVDEDDGAIVLTLRVHEGAQ